MTKPTEDREKKDSEIKDEADKKDSIKAYGWIHKNLNIKKERNMNEYSVLARNPLFAGAEHSAFLELNLLRMHFHPTVSLYAKNILDRKS